MTKKKKKTRKDKLDTFPSTALKQINQASESPVSTEGGSRASLKQGYNKQKKRRVAMIEISCLATANKLQEEEEEMIPVTLREKREVSRICLCVL